MNEIQMPVKREQVIFDGDTGELKALHGYASGEAGDRFASWQYPLHSGQMFGLPGRIIILLTELVTAVLSITGIDIWYRKQFNKMLPLKVFMLPGFQRDHAFVGLHHINF